MRRRLPDILIVGLLFLLPLLMFSEQTVGGKTLIPTENLYRFEPFATYREQVGAPPAQNELVSDLILQNYQWKAFIRDSIARREIPLWNPHQFAGIPFMAAGQQSTLYPLSVLYYVLPLPAAYGWFTVVNLWLAGVFMFALLRGLGAARIGGVVAGIAYQLCGFLIASVVHPMILGAAVWLPLILLMVEFIVRHQSLFGRQTSAPWMVVGAVAIACNVFAGHPELTIYTLLIAGYYAAARLIWNGWQERADGWMQAVITQLRPAAWLVSMVALGLGLSAVQFIPLVEFANTNWRAERGSLETVLSFAHPLRDAIMYLLPNAFGGPTYQQYTDVFTGETVLAADAIGREYIDWGIKNAVEGALYIGILPLALAAFALLDRWIIRREDDTQAPPYRLIFFILVLIAATFMFGMRTYTVIYVLPGINQLNTAFRWVYGVTVGLVVLAGFGADALHRAATDERLRRAARWAGLLLVVFGVLILAGLLLTRLSYEPFAPLFDRIVNSAAKASDTFSDGRMFYSFIFPQALALGIITLLSGLVFWLAVHGLSWRSVRLWKLAAVVLIAADLLVAMRGFNPASDPKLLDFTPPSIQWLIDREAEIGPFRYITLDDASEHAPLFHANATMRYGLDDVRGYESIIPGQYADYMRQVQSAQQLDFNRVAPLYVDRLDEIDWTRLRLLNVGYVITHHSVDLPEAMTTSSDPRRFPPQFRLAYEDEAVKIWETNPFPRAFIADTLNNERPSFENAFAQGAPVTIWQDTGREKFLDLQLTGERPQWLIVSESYAPGWRAFVRPHGAGDAFERPLPVERVLENLQSVVLNPADLRALFEDERDALEPQQQANVDNGVYTVRMVYSPTSFQVGLFASVISMALLAFVGGVWLWRLLIGSDTDDSTAAVSRVARNSIAPIILNLFNRGIDFAFAFVMLRVLGPEDAGIYYYAVVVFVWFDIFTNFGLDVFLIREASRDRSRAGYFFLNTSYLRLFLVVACVPLLIGFILIRQSAVEPALSTEALLAVGLLYIGLAPGSLNKGLTSLFYAFERAEYPAAVATITTINKAVFGLIVLLLGYGIVGLAAVSIGVNIVTLAILLWAARGMIRFGDTDDAPKEIVHHDAESRRDPGLMRQMIGESWPLMLNHFLATVFFQIDIVILEALRGARIVGQYSVAYRWLLAINIVPAFFTQALLPVMSRQAREDRAALRRTYTLGVKLLVAIAVPLAVLFTFMARALVLFLGGAEFMPVGAVALQIMIWSIPIGWINSLTQYTLIAVDLQRSITKAFFVAVSFNIVTNLIFIPQFGYQAAAVTTIFSETVLLLPFGMLLQGALGQLSWFDMVWRPVVAGSVMLVSMLVLWNVSPLLAIIVGLVIYPVLMLLLRPLNAEERRMLRPLLPARLRRVVSAVPGV